MAGGLVDERQLDGVTLTEWAERLPADIDPERITVSFEVLSDEGRRINVSPSHADQARYVDAAVAWQARDSG
jgi:tRNA A37 threonylcarbamoyladenosine biosynthesis protein TsaE